MNSSSDMHSTSKWRQMFGIFAPFGLNSSMVTTPRPSDAAFAITNGSVAPAPEQLPLLDVLLEVHDPVYLAHERALSCAGYVEEFFPLPRPVPQGLHRTVQALAAYLAGGDDPAIRHQPIKTVPQRREAASVVVLEQG